MASSASSYQTVVTMPSAAAVDPTPPKAAPCSWAAVAMAKASVKAAAPSRAQAKAPATAAPAAKRVLKATVEPPSAKPADARARTSAIAPEASVETAPIPKASTVVEAEQTASAAAAAVEKRKKALQKKLRQIQDLEERQKSGAVLDTEQTQKVATRAALEAELQAL